MLRDLQLFSVKKKCLWQLESLDNLVHALDTVVGVIETVIGFLVEGSPCQVDNLILFLVHLRGELGAVRDRFQVLDNLLATRCIINNRVEGDQSALSCRDFNKLC